MNDLIESTEFGDWLLNEIATLGARSRPAPPNGAPRAQPRLEALQVAKAVLLEFLTLQQTMLDKARAARTARVQPAAPPRPSDRSVASNGRSRPAQAMRVKSAANQR